MTLTPIWSAARGSAWCSPAGRVEKNAYVFCVLTQFHSKLKRRDIYDPSGLGAMFFAVLAVAAQLDRNYIARRPSKARSPRRTAQGHRRRLAHLRHRAEGQGRPRPRDRQEAHDKVRQERGQAPIGRLAVPGAL